MSDDRRPPEGPTPDDATPRESDVPARAPRGRRPASSAKKSAGAPPAPSTSARKRARGAEPAPVLPPESGAQVTLPPPPAGAQDVARLRAGDVTDPHAILGVHPALSEGLAGLVVRAWHPDAVSVDLLPASGGTLPMERSAPGLFGTFLPGETLPFAYRLRFTFANGGVWERDDPYRFLPTLGEVDLHLFNEGTHRRLWEKLGAHVRTVDGVRGVAFAVWAPNARRVSVVGDFCGWDGRLFPMRRMGGSGVWELFIPEIGPDTCYKFEIRTREGMLRLKTDPFAAKMQQAPATASIIVDDAAYTWGDDEWMTQRPRRDPAREPMAIYEVHLGSWLRHADDPERLLTYREVAPRLAAHVAGLGFTHVELLPIAEHPFYGSWGYQVTGFYAPTSRYGTPDDFRYLVDTLHQAGIGVILDWVPAHFPKDDHALRRFDGTALYEHEDPRMGEHPDWGTLIFNYGRHEVRNFLLANALYWLDEFHVDGLRVDAVASMLYLDYSRAPGEWLRNRYGGRENLEAIDFLRTVNDVVRTDYPGCFTVAEESTAWPGVTKPASEGGLGFTFKWNMGWMHDTLEYFARDPFYRPWHHDQLTFAMMYEYSERFIMPLSHDEVVHLKKSLLDKMPGDVWRKFANLRLLLAYQWTRPGKKLLFMGSELGTWREWDHDRGLEWHLLESAPHAGLLRFVEALGRLYGEHASLWSHDHDPHGFQWVDVADRQNSVVSYVRRDGADHVVVLLNLQPVPRERYRIGVPARGAYRCVLSSDAARFGGSDWPTPDRMDAEPVPYHGHAQSIELSLPPLGALVLAPADDVPDDVESVAADVSEPPVAAA
ncbi:1,4-alpha-glucan branching protein GlgB [Roseisolibacter agri]|uniref:1,4-alpha-glucan branching enzyme GlgB n=1 Tax=Roseisolibacter agri TaxID=2014610 RepID=A0AA37Q881_9BACT|nr:1,4-alpha-glucan branching protein GlgB [Roseisolibacter agri]GLC28074.1 1,4-alpha-glucan branching enzyme GlgB [Roseisolibacter agri]